MFQKSYSWREVALLSWAALGVACGTKVQGPAAKQPSSQMGAFPEAAIEIRDDDQSPTQDERDARRAESMARAQVNCADPEKCSPSVGLLLVGADSNRVSRCTSSLIASDLIVTNSHCIPKDWRSPGFKIPANLSKVVFALAGDYPREVADVVEVIRASTLTENNAIGDQDYSILKLSRELDRPKIEIDSSGAPRDGKFTVIKINPNLETLDGDMQIIECRNARNSIYNYSRLDRKPLTFFLHRCGIISGNSGSPIFASNGKAVGVAQAKVEKIPVESMKSIGYEIEFDPALHDLGAGSSFQCIPSVNDRQTKLIKADGCVSHSFSADIERVESYLRELALLKSIPDLTVDEIREYVWNSYLIQPLPTPEDRRFSFVMQTVCATHADRLLGGLQLDFILKAKLFLSEALEVRAESEVQDFRMGARGEIAVCQSSSPQPPSQSVPRPTPPNPAPTKPAPTRPTPTPLPRPSHPSPGAPWH